MCAVLLLIFALDAANKFAPTDAARIPFVGVPLLVALVLLTVVALTLHHFLNREILIEGSYLIYRDAKNEIHLEIPRMAYSPPADSGISRALMFSDGESFIQIPEIFLGPADFAALQEAISQRRRRSRTGDGRETFSL